MDSGTKLILCFVISLASMLLWLRMSEEAEEIPVVEEWHFAGKVGSHHFMNMTLKREGTNITGEAMNTNHASRNIRGVLGESRAFLLHEFEGGKDTGTFEGRFLENGDIRGIWTTPDGKKWFPFYLARKPESKISKNPPVRIQEGTELRKQTGFAGGAVGFKKPKS